MRFFMASDSRVCREGSSVGDWGGGMETVDVFTLAFDVLGTDHTRLLYMAALQQIAGWCCNSRLPRMQEPVVLCSSSSSATFELVARWRGSGGLGVCGEKGSIGGVGAGFVLSS